MNIKCIKPTIKNYIYIKLNIHTALLHIRSTPLCIGLPSLATLLFNHLIRGIMPTLSRLPISSNNDDEHQEALAKNKQKWIRTMILLD